MLRDRVRRRLQRVALRVKRKLKNTTAADASVGTPPLHVPQEVEEAPIAVEEPEEEVPEITREQVLDLFDDMVRPALQADGGDIELISVQSNDVHVRLTGACSSCPSSTITMKMGIERLLREEFEHFGELIQVP